MNIAIDISPVSKKSNSQHKVRGVGMYINFLIENLQKYDSKNTYYFIEDNRFPKNIDIVHYPYFDPFFLTLPFNLPKKTIVTVHDLTPIVFSRHFPAGVKGNLKWIVQRNNLNRVDAIVADSDASKKDVVKFVGINSDKVNVVYLAVSEEFKKLKRGAWENELRSRLNLPREFILYVGDATWNKNLPALIEAVKKTNSKLVLVGKIWEKSADDIADNLWNKDLKKILTIIENDDQFVKLGFVNDNDLVGLYNTAQVLVMPSIYEGFGLPVLEAMSCGCPVIAGRGGSLPEVGGDAVFYTEDSSVASIRRALEKIMSDSKLRNELSQKGLSQARLFTLEKSIRELISVYEKS